VGFVASEVVESLDYDLNVQGGNDESLRGTIAEPSTAQIETYRDALIKSFKDLGIDVDGMKDKKVNLDDMDDLLAKNKKVEADLLVATANLTGIKATVLKAVPYRIQRAFAGWIMGQFFSPEASTPATTQ
jgi:hypothetical protein